MTQKEKALLKLEKDKLQKRAHGVTGSIKAQEEKVQKQIDATHQRQRASLDQSVNEMGLLGQSTLGRGV